MRIAIVAVTREGRKIAKIVNSGFPGKSKLYCLSKGRIKNLLDKIFDKDKFEGIVFIMALGIVARLIAPHLKNKYLDPAVVAIDRVGRFVISVVSGHAGGANKLAIEIGNILYAEPVITTGSHARKNIIIGTGCRRGIKKEEIVKGIKYAVAKTKSSLNNVRYIATIDMKKNESGLKKACVELGIPLRIIPIDAIGNFKGSYKRSSFVKKKIGIEGVSEPCALLAGRKTKLILSKAKVGRVTVAVARESSI
ncbi:MAG: cobalamin biosynthesis protein [Omnitrophica bacterium]|nr:cobalamin biosynthesis protein [Candidatus Omnitrophota bacterium]MCQ9208944.1 cobalamin biosynthesis protein [Candidatus Omnitrophota bacterium]